MLAMADPDTLIKAKIHYYCRERHYHAMQVHWVNMKITHRVTQYAAVEGIKRFSGDPAFKFFYGMALVLEGQLQVVCKVCTELDLPGLQEGIRELDLVRDYSEVQLGSLLALIHAHKR